MTKLNIVVILKDNISAFERLLISVKRQTVKGIKVTAVTQQAQKLKKFEDKYDFICVESKGDLLNTVNETVKKSDSEYVLIAASDQMFEIDFYETVSDYFGKNDLIAMNISRLHRSGNFYKIYSSDNATAKDCLYTRPCVYSWVIKTALLKKNAVQLKSLSLCDQLDFLMGCLKLSKNSCYMPLSRTFIDDMTLSSDRSFVSALSTGEYALPIIKQSLRDCFEILTKTKFYKFSGRVKRYLKRKFKRLLKR